eukprot:TRINITY_DN13528_c0_g1_i1.p1 TRINITY_DN13528_c0_g1~~TRINITY_DN13528_c0_g1_i1.p1  ORF type:complete len:255 (-),score=38.56 TRINITY_DN13528_c0_g1_i1:619-1383(-)
MQPFQFIVAVRLQPAVARRGFSTIPGGSKPPPDIIKHFLSQFMTSKSKGQSADISSLYKLTAADFKKISGGQYLQQYHENLPVLVKDAFPDHAWDTNLFLDWALTSSPESRVAALKTLQNALKISHNEDWPKNLTKYSLRKSGLSVRPKNVVAALQLEFPQVQWDQIFRDSPYVAKQKEHKKGKKSKSVDAEKFRAEYKPHFDSLATNLGIVTLEDWYKHSKVDILRQSAEVRRATKFLGGGLSQRLRMAYPDH